jgi:restriction system protein
MARKSSPLEDLVAELIQSAWWVSFLVAGIAYIGLTFGFPSLLAGKQVWTGVVGLSKSIAPYAALFFCFIGGIAWLNTKRKAKLVDRQTDIDSIHSLSWKQFEELVGEIGRRKGYHVVENIKGGADGGVDVRFKKDGKLVLVQCKQWKARQVNVKVIRELYGVMAAEGAHGGLVVTAGTYTQDAREFAKGKPIDLIDGQRLEKLVADVRQGEGTFKLESNKICPTCGSIMVRRVAKKGPNIGNEFWGCSTFPKCRTVENIVTISRGRTESAGKSR